MEDGKWHEDVDIHQQTVEPEGKCRLLAEHVSEDVDRADNRFPGILYEMISPRAHPKQRDRRTLTTATTALNVLVVKITTP